jgi:hypothetical protein
VVPALGNRHEFEASLGYIGDPVSINKTKQNSLNLGEGFHTDISQNSFYILLYINFTAYKYTSRGRGVAQVPA